MTGNHNHAPVDSHPHVSSRDEVRVTMVAKPAAEFLINPDTLAHRDSACKINIPVAPFRICAECILRLLKQDLNTLPRDLFSGGVAGLLLH